MTLLINILLIIFVAKRVYWYNKYGTIKKAEVKKLKAQIKGNSVSAEVFYLGTAKQMVAELYPNAPLLEEREYRKITADFIAHKDVNVADVTTWTEVIGDFLLEKRKYESYLEARENQ